MVASENCTAIKASIDSYLNDSLSAVEKQKMAAHFEVCESCRETLHQFSAVSGLIGYVQAEIPAESGLQPKEVVAPVPVEVSRAPAFQRLFLAPWWFVSFSLHFLVIALASLISMAIAPVQNDDDAVIMMTELQQHPQAAAETKPKVEPSEALDSHKETPATDPNSKQASDIVVPPDILAQAELGDHFETINPDRPDTQSAFGNEDAKLFHSVNGNAEEAGGGGMDGLGMEDLIGYGGAASRGTGGGFGGGHGTGIGNGDGAGKGSFGSRNGGGRKLMVMRHGGTKATEGAVDRGLEWLARNQEADGHWDCAKHGGVATQFHPAPESETAVTGLALLAFLGAGHTEKVGKYKDNVARAINWFKSKQKADGEYFDSNYGHSIALMAMAEAAGMGHVPETIESAQKGVDKSTGVKMTRNSSERGGWGYSPTQSEGLTNCDLSNSGWSMMALKSAKVAGLKVPVESIEGCIAFLDGCEIGRVKGDPYSGQMFGYAADPANKGKEPGRTICNAIGCLGRLFFGTQAHEMENGAINMVKVGGLPGGANGSNSSGLYYMYYATLVTFQVGGDSWKNWNESLKATLPPLQIKGGNDDGSWDAKGEYADQWGRVGQTALSILCMEVYYRYAKLGP